MKTRYVKPITEIIKVNINRIMMSNSEPEVTYNIGANSSTFDEEDNDKPTNNGLLWDD